MLGATDRSHPSEYLHTVCEPDPSSEHARYPIEYPGSYPEGHSLLMSFSIVFVHGLNPLSKANFAELTWTHGNGNLWPVKHLPQRVPSARIHIFSYNSRAAWDTSTNGIQQHATTLLDRLSGAREARPAKGNYNVPIIFVAHSLGGLVVKQALVAAKNDDTFADLRENTYGLVFFAVPHQGGHGASLGTIAKNIVTSMTGSSKNDLVESLRANSLFQENQATFFRHQLEDYQIVSVCETKPTKIKHFAWATAIIVVDEKSAILGLTGTRERLISIDSNHSEVCKFEADNDKFDPIKRAIGRLADDAIAPMKTAADPQTPAESLTLNPYPDNEYFEVPFDNNKNYVERSSITNQLEELLDLSNPTTASTSLRVVLYGLGGAGKTELAVRFAERHRKRYKAIFWVYGADASRLKEGFERIGQTIDRDDRGPHRDLVLDAQTWFAKNRGWLLIIDNVDDQDVLDALRWHYLKGGMDGHVIVTSRNPSTSVYWNGIEVADMNHSEGTTLMTNIMGQRDGGEDTVLSKLLGDLGHLPLAIDQASSYIAATGMSIQEYHRWFEIEKARLLEEVPSTYYKYDSRQTVMTTWEISFQRIQQSHPAASKLLLMMSFFSHDDVPITMLQLKFDSLRHWSSNGEWEALPADQEWVQSELKSTLEDGLRLRDAIRSLRNFSFIRYKPGGKSLWLHPLVHYWASHKLETRPDRQKLTMCSIGLVASSFKKEDRLPPIATPYGKGDVAYVGEEKTLRLWPWRQLARMPEAMAHLCLSLLQVLEYTSTADDPVVMTRLPAKDAHRVIDHATQFSEAADGYLQVSVALWRLTRAAAIEGAVRLMEKVMTQSDVASVSPRIKATSLGLLFVIFLDGGHLLRAFLTSDVGTKVDNPLRVNALDTRAERHTQAFQHDNLALNSLPFCAWFDNPSKLDSPLERYVYNMGCYIHIRFAGALGRDCIHKGLAEQVMKVFEALCGQNSEEYRRSVWYLTNLLEEQGAWKQVRQYLEPLVAQSLDEPILVWSHERCIIRLVHAYFELGLSHEAQDLSERVQRSYNNAGKCLRSMQKNRLPAEDKISQ
ncbi:MAG: hypothetical protein Q9225_007481, partial [Loekoesia sp. 1 TL-2023]